MKLSRKTFVRGLRGKRRGIFKSKDSAPPNTSQYITEIYTVPHWRISNLKTTNNGLVIFLCAYRDLNDQTTQSGGWVLLMCGRTKGFFPTCILCASFCVEAFRVFLLCEILKSVQCNVLCVCACVRVCVCNTFVEPEPWCKHCPHRQRVLRKAPPLSQLE